MKSRLKNIKRKLISLSRELSAENLVTAAIGNISVRTSNNMYITRSGAHFANLKIQDLAGLDIKSAKVKGPIKPSIEWRMHFACYRKRPDIKAVVHTHPPALTTLTSLGIKIKPNTIEFVIYFKKGIGHIGFVPPGTAKLAKLVSSKIKSFDGVFLSGHGLVTVGKTLEQACIRSIVAEKEAKIILASKLLDKKFYALSRNQIRKIYRI